MGAILDLVMGRGFDPQLSSCEYALIVAVDKGEEADSGANDLVDVQKCPYMLLAPYTVRAELITLLCSQPPEVMARYPHAIRIRGYRIYGTLDLNSLFISVNLSFRSCEFPKGIDLCHATTASVNMAGSSTSGIKANGLTVRGELRLSDNFFSDRPIVLVGAAITGDLNCIGANFSCTGDPEGAPTCRTDCDRCRGLVLQSYVLRFKSIKIDGNLLLCGHCFVDGGVLLEDAIIAGNLNCTLGTFRAKSTKGSREQRKDGRRLPCEADADYHLACALNGDGMQVRGNVLLNKSEFLGEMRLTGVRIDGDVECAGGKFSPYGADSIHADRLRVRGNLFFSEIQATGIVRLPRAEIGADVSFWKSELSYDRADFPALYSEGIKVDGTVHMNHFVSNGAVDLSSAIVTGNLNCSDSRFLCCSGVALNAKGISVGGHVAMNGKFTATGMVSLDDANIGSFLDCEGGNFSEPTSGEKKNEEIYALSAGKVRVGGSIYLNGGFEARGEVMFNDASTCRNLVCEHGTIKNPNGYSLRGTQMKITGSAIMSWFRSEGHLRLDNAVIEGNLYFKESRLICSEMEYNLIEDHSDQTLRANYALDAYGARIIGDAVFEKKFHAKGIVSLRSAEIGGTLRWKEINASECAILDLRSCKAECLEDKPDSWPKKAYLNGFEYRYFQGPVFNITMRIKEWLQSGQFGAQSHNAGPQQSEPQQPCTQRFEHERFEPQPYEQLAAVLRQQGYERQAKEVLIEKNKMLADLPVRKDDWLLRLLNRKAGKNWTSPEEESQSQSLLMRIWMRVIGVTVGYGFKPYQALAFSVAFIALGTALFTWGFTAKVMKRTKEGGFSLMVEKAAPPAQASSPSTQTTSKKPAQDGAKRPSLFDKKFLEQLGFSFLYSLDNFLPGVNLQAREYYLPTLHPDDESRSWIGLLLEIYRVVHTLLGWIFTALFLAAVSGIVRR